MCHIAYKSYFIHPLSHSFIIVHAFFRHHSFVHRVIDTTCLLADEDAVHHSEHLQHDSDMASLFSSDAFAPLTSREACAPPRTNNTSQLSATIARMQAQNPLSSLMSAFPPSFAEVKSTTSTTAPAANNLLYSGNQSFDQIDEAQRKRQPSRRREVE